MSAPNTEAAAAVEAPIPVPALAEPVPSDVSVAEDGDEAGALAALREFRASLRSQVVDEPAEPATTVDTPTEVATPVPAPAVTPVPPDPKQAQLFERLTASENELRKERARIKDLEAAAARAAEYDALVAKAGEDPEPLFSKIKWTPEKVLQYAEKGKAALAPEAAKAQLTAVEQRIQQLEQQLAAKEQAETVRAYKSTVSQTVSGKTADYPYLAARHTDPDTGVLDAQAMADEIFDLQARAFNGEGRELTIEEAAASLDGGIKQLSRRFAKVLGSGHVTTPAPAAPKPAAPSTRQATAAPTQSAKSIPAQDEGDPDEASALAVLRAHRAATRV